MPPAERPLLIGITGNIGSGKTLFCRYLKDYGLSIVSADEVAGRCLLQSDVVEKLTERYSTDILECGEVPVVDRRKLAARVFSDPVETKFLNSLIHPLVLQEFSRIVLSCRMSHLVFEVPLLFEAGLQNCFDYLILVYAPLIKRLERLANRGDNMDSLKRQKQQLPDEEKLGRVDLIISNLHDPVALQNAALSFVQSLEQLKMKEVKPFINN